MHSKVTIEWMAVALLWLTVGDSAIITRPSDAPFNCSDIDPGYPINWWYTPVGSKGPRDFYFSEGFDKEHRFYSSGFSISEKSFQKSFDLILENVTSGPAENRDCDDRAHESVSASAELTVVIILPTCGNFNLTETEITCNLSLSGSIAPKLTCQDGCYNSSASAFNRRDKSVPRYVSTRARLANTIAETQFVCSVLRDYNLPPPIGIYVLVKHKLIQNKEPVISLTPDSPRTIKNTSINPLLFPLIVSSTFFTITIVVFAAIIYKCDVSRKVQRYRYITVADRILHSRVI